MKKQKEVFSAGLSLHLKHLMMLAELKGMGADVAEIKRRGAEREIEKEYRRQFSPTKAS